jgi:hypothetical protein
MLRNDTAALVAQPPGLFIGVSAGASKSATEKTARVIPSRHRTLGLNGYSIALLGAAAIATPVELTVILGQNPSTEGPEWEFAPH